MRLLLVKYRASGIHFTDTTFLSDEQIVACGSIQVDRENMESDEGAVFYSSDGGRTWSIIYRNAKVKSVNKLAVVSSHDIWAVGEGGLFLRLEPPH